MLEKFGIGSDLISTLGAISFFVVVIVTAFVVLKYVRDMKEKVDTSVPMTDEKWDGIGEYKNELPMGWAVTYLIVAVWCGWYYLAGYPLNAYSQIGEYNEEVKAHEQKFNAKWQSADQKTLEAMGESVFTAKCSACHGLTGDGMNGKAVNFADWGNAKGIENTIKHGAKGLGFPMGEMPAGLVDEAGAKKVAAYVLNQVSDGKKPANEALVAEGKAIFDATCVSCHGADGKGNNAMAPDLSAYGTPRFASEVVLVKGKKGHIGNMPSFDKEGTLTKIQYKAVATFIDSQMSNAKK
jgi:cytochrome c oxidase cbb3-type subunit 3